MKTLSTAPSGPSEARIAVADAEPEATTATGSLVPLDLKLERIIVPVDFSEHSLKAARHALALATRYGAEVTLVHIVEQIIYPGDWMYPPMAMSDFAAEKRTEIANRLRGLGAGSGIKTTEIVRLGRAWQEIVEIAKERKADLVVLATHGYTGLRHVLLGSVAEKVVRHAPCPVLTVRAEDRDFL